MLLIATGGLPVIDAFVKNGCNATRSQRKVTSAVVSVGVVRAPEARQIDQIDQVRSNPLSVLQISRWQIFKICLFDLYDEAPGHRMEAAVICITFVQAHVFLDCICAINTCPAQHLVTVEYKWDLQMICL